MRLNVKVFLTSFLLAWLIISVLLYLYVSRIGYVQVVRATNWEAFRETLAQTSLLGYTVELLGSFLGNILFSLACLSLGLSILWKWAQVQTSYLAVGVSAFLIGEILFSLIFLTVISLNRLTPAFVAVMVCLGFLLGFPALRGFLTKLSSRSSLTFELESDDRIILFLCMASLSLGLLLSATRLGYDAAAEYFSHAKIMAVSQLPVFFYPNENFVVSSFHPGILFTALIQLFGDQSARMLSWINGTAILWMGLALAQEVGLRLRARLWFLTLALTSTAFVDLLGDGKVELISTAPIVAAVYWLARSVQEPDRYAFALIGFFAGFGIIARPYNIFLVSLFVALFVLSEAIIKFRAGRFHLKQFIGPVLWMVPALLALGMFHLFQNWIWLGNPIAPLTYARQLDSTDWAWQLDPANLTLYRLLYPLLLSYSNSPQSLGNISPLAMGFLPFLLVKNVREKMQLSAILRRLTLITILTLLVWITLYFTVLEIRYVFFLWMILFLALAQVVDSALQQVEPGIRSILYMLVIGLFIVMCIRTVLISFTAYLPNRPLRPADCHDTSLCAIMEILNKPAAPGDRVFVLHAYRYYLRPDLFACSSRVEEYASLQPLARQNSADFWIELYRQGYRFIMYEKHLSERRYFFGSLPGLETAPKWMNIKVLYASPTKEQMIYEMEAIDPPFPPQVFCRQDSMGQWQLVSDSSLPLP